MPKKQTSRDYGVSEVDRVLLEHGSDRAAVWFRWSGEAYPFSQRRSAPRAGEVYCRQAIATVPSEGYYYLLSMRGREAVFCLGKGFFTFPR